MTIQNTGTTHFTSRYSINVKNIFGEAAIATSSNETLILPGTVKAVLDKVATPKWPGLYKIEYNIGLGDSPAVVKTHYIIYLPSVFWTSLAILAIVISGIYLLRKVGRKR
jgi:hypothetical protein